MADKAKTPETPEVETPTADAPVKIELGDAFYFGSLVAFTDSTVSAFAPRKAKDAKVTMAEVIRLSAYFAQNDPSKVQDILNRLTD